MQDRVPLYPGRVTLTPVSGQANTYDMARADQPTQEGTPLNKSTLLTDATAALFGLGTDAVPDDVFRLLSVYYNQNLIDKAVVIVRCVDQNGDPLQKMPVKNSELSTTSNVNGYAIFLFSSGGEKEILFEGDMVGLQYPEPITVEAVIGKLSYSEAVYTIKNHGTVQIKTSQTLQLHDSLIGKEIDYEVVAGGASGQAISYGGLGIALGGTPGEVKRGKINVTESQVVIVIGSGGSSVSVTTGGTNGIAGGNSSLKIGSTTISANGGGVLDKVYRWGASSSPNPPTSLPNGANGHGGILIGADKGDPYYTAYFGKNGTNGGNGGQYSDSYDNPNSSVPPSNGYGVSTVSTLVADLTFSIVGQSIAGQGNHPVPSDGIEEGAATSHIAGRTPGSGGGAAFVNRGDTSSGAGANGIVILAW